MSTEPFQSGQYGDGVKSPEELHAETLADESLPAIQREVVAEQPPAPVKTVQVPMGNGVEIDVPMQSTWRVFAMDAMRAGDFDGWAEEVLSDADLERWDEWYQSGPTMDAMTTFFGEVGKATGTVAGQNRASRRQSQRTQRR